MPIKRLFDEKCSICGEKLRYEDATFYKLNGERPDLAEQIYICPDCKDKIDYYIRSRRAVRIDLERWMEDDKKENQNG